MAVFRDSIEEPLVRRLTKADVRALELLATFSGSLVRAGFFGTTLWPNGTRTPSAYARPAGRVLSRLVKAGVARWRNEKAESKQFGWEIVTAGHEYLKRRQEDIDRTKRT